MFTTRVELYGDPSKQVYDKLHAAMLSKKFYQKMNDNGVSFTLPHAEYASSQDMTAIQVLNEAKIAAASVWKDFCVLVTQTTQRREHYNLKTS